MTKLAVLHAVPDLRQRAGGIASAMTSLARATRSSSGVNHTFITFEADAASGLATQTAEVSKPLFPWQLRRSLRRLIAAKASDSARVGQKFVCHSHGLWSPLNHFFAQEAIRASVPLVISPHGMLMPWARRHRGIRKALAWSLYQATDLNSADAIHVTSENEAAVVEGCGIDVPIAEVPFGVDIPSWRALGRKYTGDCRTLLFMGRIHPVKNLLTLIESWGEVRPLGWCLHIVGPDEGGYRPELEAKVAAASLAHCVKFDGPVFGEQKTRTFANAHALVLPSHSENYGAVVAEALAHGLPVIASTGSPWSIIQNVRCGWYASPDRRSLTQAIRSLVGTEDSKLIEMGSHGRDYITANRSHDMCGSRFIALYDKVSSPRQHETARCR